MKIDKLSKSLYMLLALSCALAMAGCNSTTDTATRGVAILQPQNGAQLRSGEVIDIHSRFIVSDGAVAASLRVNEQSIRRDPFAAPLDQGSLYQPWRPPGAGVYKLTVVIESSNGDQAISPEVIVYVSAEPLLADTTAAPPVESVETIIRTMTTTPTTTPTEGTTTPEIPMAIAKLDANCRSGPSPAYDILGSLKQGETAPISGRNNESSWWTVQLSNGIACWVWGEAIIVQGNSSTLAVITAPSPPTLTATLQVTLPPKPIYSACHDYPDIATCNANPQSFPGCYWDTGFNKCMP